MNLRRMRLPPVLGVLAFMPALALAQMGSGQGMMGSSGMRGPMGKGGGRMMQGLMQRMVAMMRGRSMPPEQMKRMGDLMEQMSGRMGRMGPG